jgi:transposase
MHVDSSSLSRGDKTYTRHLLRESFREGGKVKHRTVANLSHCSPQEIEAIKLALKHKQDLSVLVPLEEVCVEQGQRVGAVVCVHAIAQRLGIAQALGSHRQGRLALWQVCARLINQGSRLSAVRLAQSHAACEVLGLEPFCEDQLYENLAWLCEEQAAVEKRLFRRRYGKAVPQLFLYDVTSTYLEGDHNALAAFGYNRDGKKGKKQLVVGLLTWPDGAPVAVRVFRGNTSDPTTVSEQVRTLAQAFGVEEVVLVGDRGMIKSKQMALLEDADFHYIGAITKPQIRNLLQKKILQLDLFDEPLSEVVHETGRYVLRRNPVRQQEVAASRQDRVAKLRSLAARLTRYLADHPRAKVEVSHGKLVSRLEAYGMDGFVTVETDGRTLSIVVDEAAQQEASVLDGCYVLTTDLPVAALSKEDVHDRYKDLAKVERAFRTWKTGHLELRPVHVHTEQSTRGHVFVVMLAHLIERELDTYWRGLETTVPEAIDQLGSLCATLVTVKEVTCQKIPTPNEAVQTLLSAANVRLPEVLPAPRGPVATRSKLVPGRKTL